MLAIQLMALPVNRPNKEDMSDLPAKCIVAETTTHTLRETDAKFDFSVTGSSQAVHVLTVSEMLDMRKGQKLHFRVLVKIRKNDEIGSV